MATYSEKLKSPKWQKKRLEILQRDEFKCCYCSDSETELQIHHLKYTGEPWEAKNEDLISLCKHCHRLISYDKTLKIVSVIKHKCFKDTIGMVVKEVENNKPVVSLYDYSPNGNIIPVVAFNQHSEILTSINNLINGK